MEDPILAAEVVPTGKNDAPEMLQSFGFRILHVGTYSISVEGPESLWTKTFNVTFETKSNGTVAYRKPTHEVAVPVGFADKISSVAFAVPPELL